MSEVCTADAGVRDWLLEYLCALPHVSVTDVSGFPTEFGGPEFSIRQVERLLPQCTAELRAFWPRVRRWCGTQNAQLAEGWQLWAELCIHGRVQAFSDEPSPANDTAGARFADVIPFCGDAAAEAPVAEAPVAEAPVAEAPVAEAPAAEAPAATAVVDATAAVAVAVEGYRRTRFDRLPLIGLATLAAATAVAVIWPSSPAPAVAQPLPVSARYATCETAPAAAVAGGASTVRPISAPPTPRYRVAAPRTEHASAGPIVVRRKGRADVAIETRRVTEPPPGSRIVELGPDTATVIALDQDGSERIAIEADAPVVAP